MNFVRRNDKSVEVRLIWVNFMLPLIQNHPERAKEACGSSQG